VRAITSIMGLALGLTVMAMPSMAQASEGYVRLASNLRAGPATRYPVIDYVGRGQQVHVYGCLRGYTWCDVSADGERGWLPGRNIEILYAGRRRVVTGGSVDLGLAILPFAMGNYWANNYVDRPFYQDRRWRDESNNFYPYQQPRVVRQPRYQGETKQYYVTPQGNYATPGPYVRPYPKPGQERAPGFQPDNTCDITTGKGCH